MSRKYGVSNIAEYLNRLYKKKPQIAKIKICSNRLRLISKLRQGLIQKDKVHIDREEGAQISSLANKMEHNGDPILSLRNP